jgi:hypothetical protein
MTTEQIKRDIRIYGRIADLKQLAAETTLAYYDPSRRLQIELHLTGSIKTRPCATAFAPRAMRPVRKRCRIGRRRLDWSPGCQDFQHIFSIRSH